MNSLEPEMSRASLRLPVDPPINEAVSRDAAAIMRTLLWRVRASTPVDTSGEPMAPTLLHNYPGSGFEHMTTLSWNQLPACCKGSWMECTSGDPNAPRRVRVALTADADLLPVYLTDAVRTDVPWFDA